MGFGRDRDGHLGQARPAAAVAPASATDARWRPPGGCRPCQVRQVHAAPRRRRSQESCLCTPLQYYPPLCHRKAPAAERTDSQNIIENWTCNSPRSSVALQQVGLIHAVCFPEHLRVTRGALESTQQLQRREKENRAHIIYTIYAVYNLLTDGY